MAPWTHLTLVPECPPFDTNNGESSSSATLRHLLDELSQYAENPEDIGDSPISSALPIHILLEKKDGNYKRDVESRKDYDEHESNDALNDEPQQAKLLVDEFMRSHPSPPHCEDAITGSLPCPVIIPQRRPRDWRRGFMRAYAPVLADNGISEDTFMDFLKTFYAVSRYLPWLFVINAAASNLFPISIVHFVASYAIDLALEAEAKSRTNAFLDRMNKEFFQPRGLYCLIMTYDPRSKAAHTSVNITRSVRYSMKLASSVLPITRLTSNRTHSLELPEAAPLVFPEMDPGDPLFQPFRWTQKSFANYIDRRAQARYAERNPPKALATMAPGPVSWLAINPTPTSEGIEAVESEIQVMSDKEQKGKRKEPNKGTGRRWFKEDVLYLMIVNLPTKAELAAVKESCWSTYLGV